MRTMLGLTVALGLAGPAAAGVLYKNVDETNMRVNPLADANGAPRIVFDDVLVPTSAYNPGSRFTVTRVGIALRRMGIFSPAQRITFYHSQFAGGRLVAPVEFGFLDIPQSGPTTLRVTELWRIGDGVTPLFSIAPDETLAAGFGAFAIGIQMEDTTTNTGWRTTNGPMTNLNAGWYWDLAAGAQTGPFNFAGDNPPPVTMYLTVEGFTAPAPGAIAFMGLGVAALGWRRR